MARAFKFFAAFFVTAVVIFGAILGIKLGCIQYFL